MNDKENKWKERRKKLKKDLEKLKEKREEEEWIEFRTEVRADGRITIPYKIRENEGLHQGDYLVVKVKRGDGES